MTAVDEILAIFRKQIEENKWGKPENMLHALQQEDTHVNVILSSNRHNKLSVGKLLMLADKGEERLVNVTLHDVQSIYLTIGTYLTNEEIVEEFESEDGLPMFTYVSIDGISFDWDDMNDEDHVVIDKEQHHG